MTEISNELLANLVMEMNGKLNQRLAGIESFLLAIGQQIEKMAESEGRQKENMRALEDRLMMAVGALMAETIGAKTTIDNLSAVEFNVASRGGEDGIIDWLVSHMQVSAPRFIEASSGDFSRGKCRFLAARYNWKGMLFDADGPMTYHARHSDFYRLHNLSVMEAAFTIENVDDLITTNEFAGPLGLLALSTGGTEYWVWDALTAVTPDIMVVPFNAVLGDRYAITIPYNSHFNAAAAHASGYYHGASIAALKALAQEKSYAFLGTNSKGTTAFFARSALADSVLPLIKEVRAFPARARNPGDPFEELESVGGISRFNLIKHLPVIDVATGRQSALGSLDQPYSQEWQRGMV